MYHHWSTVMAPLTSSTIGKQLTNQHYQPLWAMFSHHSRANSPSNSPLLSLIHHRSPSVFVIHHHHHSPSNLHKFTIHHPPSFTFQVSIIRHGDRFLWLPISGHPAPPGTTSRWAPSWEVRVSPGQSWPRPGPRTNGRRWLPSLGCGAGSFLGMCCGWGLGRWVLAMVDGGSAVGEWCRVNDGEWW